VSDTIKNLISAIAMGDAATTQDAFNAAMAEKVSVALDNRRAEVASTMFKTEEPMSAEEPTATEE
jgi:hypothetical protein